MAIKIVQASYEHIPPIVMGMRASDVAEVWASDHVTPVEALTMSFHESILRWTALHNGEPFAMFGVYAPSPLCPVGAPWLLATDKMKKLQYRVAKLSREYVKKMSEAFPHLLNYVHENNVDSVKWLQWCGFRIYPAEPYGKEQERFHRFEMKRGGQ